MTSDTKFQLALFLLLLALGIILAKNLVANTALTVDVNPKIAMTNPHKSTTFRVRLRIEPHPDNREYSYFATCGEEQKSSIRKVDSTTVTFFEELTVVSNCLFQVCLSRLGQKKPLCVKQEVLVN